MKKEIKILPIFNPTECNFWDKFTLVYRETTEHNYKTTITPENINVLMQEINKIHGKPNHNIVFAAYDSYRLVGCLVGHIRNKCATIQYLYVLPEYQGYKIGTQLLIAAEHTASLVANKSELISWGGAELFYQKHKYTSPTKDNKYIKDIRNKGNYLVSPVFHCDSKILKAISKISQKSYEEIKQEIKPRTPVFVYRNPNIFISGYGFINDKNESVIYTNAGDKFVQEQIAKRIAMYQQKMSVIR